MNHIKVVCVCMYVCVCSRYTTPQLLVPTDSATTPTDVAKTPPPPRSNPISTCRLHDASTTPPLYIPPPAALTPRPLHLPTPTPHRGYRRAMRERPRCSSFGADAGRSNLQKKKSSNMSAHPHPKRRFRAYHTDSSLLESSRLLFSHTQALELLVQGGWIYRAIQMCINHFEWETAYDLARAHATHLDTVLYFRNRHLRQAQCEETIPKLKQLAADLGPVDERAVSPTPLRQKHPELLP